MPKKPITDMTGQRYGRLVVIDLAPRSPSGRVRWNCRCDCGAMTVAQANNLRSGNTTSCGCYIREISAARFAIVGRLPNRQKPDDEIGYTAAHDRVRKLYGSASQYFCVDCLGWADDWSLNHLSGSPKIRTDEASGMLISPDPDDYVPRCSSCHWRYDRGAA